AEQSGILRAESRPAREGRVAPGKSAGDPEGGTGRTAFRSSNHTAASRRGPLQTRVLLGVRTRGPTAATDCRTVESTRRRRTTACARIAKRRVDCQGKGAAVQRILLPQCFYRRAILWSAGFPPGRPQR